MGTESNVLGTESNVLGTESNILDTMQIASSLRRKTSLIGSVSLTRSDTAS